MKNAMLKAWVKVQQWSRKQEGQGMVEYGLIIALIAVVAIVALTSVGQTIGHLFNNVVGNLGGTVTSNVSNNG